MKKDVKVIVNGDTSRYERSMRNMRRVSETTSKKIQGHFTGIKSRVTGLMGKVTALTALLGAGTFTALIRDSFATIDTLAKTGDAIGMSTEALSTFQYAADLSGVSNMTLNSSLMRMSKRLGEATKGYGAAKRELAGLGLSAQDLIKLPLEQTFIVVAEKIKGLGTEAEKSAAAAAIFGREGIALVNMLNLGREGLIKAYKEAEKFGITISRIDAKQIEEANDAFVRARMAVRGAAWMMAVALAPSVRDVTLRFAEWVAQNRELIATRIPQFIDGVLNQINRVIGLFNKLPEGIVGTAGYGVIGRILFGGPKGMLYGVLFKIGMTIGNVIYEATHKTKTAMEELEQAKKDLLREIATRDPVFDKDKLELLRARLQTVKDRLKILREEKEKYNKEASKTVKDKLPTVTPQSWTPAGQTGVTPAAYYPGGAGNRNEDPYAAALPAWLLNPGLAGDIAQTGVESAKNIAKKVREAFVTTASEYEDAGLWEHQARERYDVMSRQYDAMEQLEQDRLENLIKTSTREGEILQEKYGAHEVMMWEHMARMADSETRLAEHVAMMEDLKTRTRQRGFDATQAIGRAAINWGGKLGEKIFLVMKGIEVAKATAAAFSASNLALANPPGPPFTIPLAAAVLATGLANAASIAAIAIGQTKTGSVSGGNIAYTSDIGMSPVVSAAETEKTGTLIINVYGDYIGEEGYLEMLAEKMSEAVEDKNVRLVASNAQYAEALS